MAYSFIPNTADQIKRRDLQLLFADAQIISGMVNPLAINPLTLDKKHPHVKLHRSVAHKQISNIFPETLYQFLKRTYPSIKLIIGNGSRFVYGGFVLENQIKYDIKNYIFNKKRPYNFTNYLNKPVILQGLSEFIDIDSIINVYTPPIGKRNLVVNKSSILIANSEGSDLADLVIETSDMQEHYISIKKGEEYRIFNVGVKHIMSDDLQRTQFFHHLWLNKPNNEPSNIGKVSISNFLSSGLGNNYILIIENKDQFKFQHITNHYSKEACKVENYSAIGNTAYITTANYEMKLELRNDKGSKEPTVLQGKVTKHLNKIKERCLDDQEASKS